MPLQSFTCENTLLSGPCSHLSEKHKQLTNYGKCIFILSLFKRLQYVKKKNFGNDPVKILKCTS